MKVTLLFLFELSMYHVFRCNNTFNNCLTLCSLLKSLSHSSADVNPEHHVKILEALIMVGGLMEIQAAPGRPSEVLVIFFIFCRFAFSDDLLFIYLEFNNSLFELCDCKLIGSTYLCGWTFLEVHVKYCLLWI